jgi:hypothetical protein
MVDKMDQDAWFANLEAVMAEVPTEAKPGANEQVDEPEIEDFPDIPDYLLDDMDDRDIPDDNVVEPEMGLVMAMLARGEDQPLAGDGS